mmetsp:Transcript_34592/g.62302  ORF Transcript_34592/g.62302 Transcript_34592/m.62302 type:complete len:797 (-) Transcript_34592:515-2905(-)|eukprot:CAMPEP_0175053144 /NCGR_PEP_ID=MMETSP0052_2-20121109/8760_1 /TAXON_ID=51329 ORGANISM="Polytomella parva, Strain SAG 63-3" /NCGR_SAMPLE_ID=MMETSP0052_2 /ASSEMBLY_ACC=CAM_ASM_000194 /LENGTH=796 /DNA_ID=CAMNT_0016317643 /DNA_START=69 /DNA_END=2459 /DNA_ORIENTATION=+
MVYPHVAVAQPLLSRSSLFNYSRRHVKDFEWHVIYLITLIATIGGGVYGFLNRNTAFESITESGFDDPKLCPYGSLSLERRLIQDPNPIPFDIGLFLRSSTTWIAASAGGSVILSFVFVNLVRFHARSLVFLALTLQVAAPVVAGFFMLSANNLAMSIIFFASAAILLFTFLLWSRQIELVIRLLGASGRALSANSGLAPSSLLCILVLIALELPMVLGLVAAYSNGTLAYNHKRGDKGAAKMPGTCTNKESGDPVSCCVWDLDPWVPGYLTLSAAVMLWTAMIAFQVRLYTVAGTVGQWYFGRENRSCEEEIGGVAEAVGCDDDGDDDGDNGHNSSQNEYSIAVDPNGQIVRIPIAPSAPGMGLSHSLPHRGKEGKRGGSGSHHVSGGDHHSQGSCCPCCCCFPCCCCCGDNDNHDDYDNDNDNDTCNDSMCAYLNPLRLLCLPCALLTCLLGGGCRRRHRSRSRVRRSLGHAMGPSFGSVCKAGGLLSLCSLTRQALDKARRQREDSLLMALVTAVAGCFIAAIEYVTKFATIYAAITGDSWATSGRRVVRLLYRNGLDAYGVWWLPPLILHSLAVSLSAVWGVVVWTVCRHSKAFQIQDPRAAIVMGSISFLASWVVLSFFGNLLLDISDTLFVCFGMDRESRTVSRVEIHELYGAFPTVGIVVLNPDGSVTYAAPSTVPAHVHNYYCGGGCGGGGNVVESTVGHNHYDQHNNQHQHQHPHQHQHQHVHVAPPPQYPLPPPPPPQFSPPPPVMPQVCHHQPHNYYAPPLPPPPPPPHHGGVAYGQPVHGYGYP